MSERHIFLGMPGYGNQTAAAGRAFYLCCQDITDGRRCKSNALPDRVIKEQRPGSLLAANMNGLWADALTLRHRKQRIDYFAMLHDDIGLEDFWLDKLIDELDSSGLDILAVVSPIKDHRGLTSTAIDKKDADSPWDCVRLTMDEVYKLPPTFTSDDVGGDLLLNTGCWVCRFDKFAEYPFYFTINDEITFCPTLGKYVANVESEDWFFSRLCHKAGMKVGATRKIALFHEGATRYVNTCPWGSQRFDEGIIDKSQVSERNDGFKFPNDVDGWLDFIEGEALFNLARGKRVLEIGSYCGRSTICLAQSAASVLAVDTFDGRGTPKPHDTLPKFSENIRNYRLAKKVKKHCGTIGDAIEQLNGQITGQFDLVFIDGAHDYKSVKSDIEHALEALKPDGIIAFHDYRPHVWDQGVKQAVHELIGDRGELVAVHGTIAVVRTSAAIPLEV